jgi:CIC family chloride channel protein
VGLILHWFTHDGRARSVADVIEGAALANGRVETKAGVASALASLVTLGSGGSSGREGPVVHMAGVISTWMSNWIKADGITGRDLLGCAVAAAVSASFNAPIAGAIFALEVVLRHFAVHAFAPIVIASAAGTVINRLEFGDVTEFSLGSNTSLAFYVELPAFLILGLVSGLVAVIFMRATFWADDLGSLVQHLARIPRWLRPAIAGCALGGLAIFFPHIIGVGYETTSVALTGQLLLHEAMIFAILKGVAASITLAGRMGGGVFSPSLMIGALVGWPLG